MDELMDLIATDESPSQISDKIKDMLFAKSADKVDNFRPKVASSVFDGQDDSEEEDVETVSDDETEETESETEEEEE